MGLVLNKLTMFLSTVLVLSIVASLGKQEN